jgi:hypothetical protein
VSSSDLTPYGEAAGLRPPENESTAAQGTPEVSTEPGFVDPMSPSEHPTDGSPEKEVIVSSTAPSEGTFFVDEQPAAPAPAAPAPAAPPPVAPVAPVAPVEQEPMPAPIGGGMRDVPLGTLIFRAGLLAEEQLEDALQEGMRTGKRLGEVLAERGLIRDSDLGRLLAGQQGLPYVEVATLAVDPAAVRMLPDNIARMQNALAFALDNGVPVVAVADPTNELVIENVRRALGTEPGLVVAAHGELAKKINEVYSGAAPAAQPVAADPPPAVAPPAPVPAPEPVLAPQQVEVPEPVAAPTPEPPVQVEEPEPAPAPTPMPTSMPPAEERTPDAQPLVVEPLVIAAAPAEVPPLHAEAAQQPPLAPEPVAIPAPVVEPAAEPVHVAEHVEPTAVEQQPVEPAIVVAEPAATVEPTVAVEPDPVPMEEPAVPAEPAVTAEPEVAVAPAEAGLITQAAEQALAPAEQPVAPTPEPAPLADAMPAQPEHTAQENDTAPEVVPTHFVVLRLAQEDHVEIGGFASKDEAESFARTVVGRIGRAEEQAEWPVFEGRFVRPQTIVSVDVVEEAPPEWGGSAMRTRSFDPGA